MRRIGIYSVIIIFAVLLLSVALRGSRKSNTDENVCHSESDTTIKSQQVESAQDLPMGWTQLHMLEEDFYMSLQPKYCLPIANCL